MLYRTSSEEKDLYVHIGLSEICGMLINYKILLQLSNERDSIDSNKSVNTNDGVIAKTVWTKETKLLNKNTLSFSASVCR